MSYAMTYTSLLQDVRAYLERGFSSSSDPQVFEQLPKLVTLAERQAARDLKVLGFVRAVTLPLSTGVAVYTKPDRWRNTISMRTDSGVLFARSYEYIRNYWPVETTTGTPEFYSDYDYLHWIIAPTPSSALVMEILYHEQPDFLGDENATNWLTDFAPDVLLYATLLQCMPFLKNDERIPVWQQMYQQAAASLSGEDMKRIMDRTSSRTEV